MPLQNVCSMLETSRQPLSVNWEMFLRSWGHLQYDKDSLFIGDVDFHEDSCTNINIKNVIGESVNCETVYYEISTGTYSCMEDLLQILINL